MNKEGIKARRVMGKWTGSLEEMVMDTFWKGKRVFLTGHTGFKGSWLCRILINVGAVLTGYSLEPPTIPNLFSICDVESGMTSVIGDIRDRKKLMDTFKQSEPQIVIHMAAQPLVRESYRDPAHTYEVNAIGTVNILECVRQGGVKSFLNVTTDKVYHDKEWEWGYRETDQLNGFDPYSNSKSCSELITHSYKNAFFADNKTAISTARAGNVLGGGDFASDRIIPDCIRSVERNQPIIVRNPHSTRPYQHVLEPLFAYLMIVERQYEDTSFQGFYNVGPDDSGCMSTGSLVDMFCKAWGDGLTWKNVSDGGPHESNFLKLDCSKIKSVFGWKPRWDAQETINKVVEWTRVYLADRDAKDIPLIMDRQTNEFLAQGVGVNA